MRRLFLLYFVLSCGWGCSPQDHAGPPSSPPAAAPARVPQAERTHDFDVLHYSFRIELGETPRKTEGAAEITLASTVPLLSSIRLDASDMTFERVEDGTGRELPFVHQDPSLVITLPTALPVGEKATVKLAWKGTPTRGLHWVTPDAAYPDKPFQIWSQGETEYTHHWLPCYDYPNDPATAQITVVAPEGYRVVSNGVLAEPVPVRDGRASWTWTENTPFASYLLSVVVGKFDEVRETCTLGEREVLLQYFAPAGQSTPEEILHTFRKTPEMMRFFSENLGVPYPYGKYAQTVAVDFTWGGMENVSATTLHEKAVIPKALQGEKDSEGLIAHELAHQWFGDLVPCCGWENLWLNESFASYFDALWKENSRGRDALIRDLRGGREWHLGELAEGSDRPVATDRYADAEDLFDSRIYAKGAWVLHLLRDVVGDSAWWRGVGEYVRRYQGRCATTEDFQKVMEEVYPGSLDWFFDRWIRGTGIPEFRVSREWIASHRQLKLTVEQVQTSGLFRLPVEIEVEWEVPAESKEESRQLFRIWSEKSFQEFNMILPAEPLVVRFDPGEKILKKLEYRRTLPEILYQLKSGRDGVARALAAEDLADLSDPEKAKKGFGVVEESERGNAVSGLAEALSADPEEWVKETAAGSLGKIGGPAARDALLGAVDGEFPRVRRAVLAALAMWAGEEPVRKTLVHSLEGDASPLCRAAAAVSLGKAGAEGVEVLVRTLESPGTDEWLLAGAIEGAGGTGDPRVVEPLLKQFAYGRPVALRANSAGQLSKVGKGREDVLAALSGALNDSSFKVIRAAIRALNDLGDVRAVPALRLLTERTGEERLKRAAMNAIHHLESGQENEDEPDEE